MATISSAGLGSGLDVNGLVTQLVAAEKAPQQAQITRKQTSIVTEISALGSLKGALADFQSSLAQLKTVGAFGVRAATSSDDEIFTATATTAAAAGSYDVEVEQIADAQQLSSSAFTGGSSAEVGTGTLTLNLGGAGFSVVVDSAHSSLADIRDAINRAGDNPGIRASIVNATDGAHLVLSSAKTGSTNTITVSVDGDSGGLSRLAYAPGNTSNYTQSHAAADSIVRIAGFEHRSADRTITGAIDGVTLSLVEAEPDTTLTLKISNDVGTATSRIQTFVARYNALQKQMADLRAYEPNSGKAGPLIGDALLRGVEAEVRRNLTGSVGDATGAYTSLSSLGITTSKTGALELDSAKLKTALETNFDGVATVFGSQNGVAARLSAALEPRLAASGDLAIRTKRLNERSTELQKAQAQLETRMAGVEARYRKQFTTLDTLLSNMQSTSSYLSQQLANAANIGKD
jgi:flagellar hook-associated protein 2